MLRYKQQVDKLDCGILVIQIIYNFFYNKEISLTTLKLQANYNENGLNLFELSSLGQKNGLKLEPLKGDFDSFKKLRIINPIIVVIKNDLFLHYVIVEKITNKNNVIFFDPTIGKRKISLEEFEKIFSNIIIVCSKESNYSKSSNQLNKIKLFNFDYKKEHILINVLTFFIISFSFFGSFYLKIILDKILFSNLFVDLIIITFLFTVISFIKILLSIFQELIVKKMEISYNKELINNYIDKLERVELIKVLHIDESVHLQNLEIIFKISQFKSRYILNLFTDLFSLVLSIIFLILLNLQIFLIALFLSCFSLVISFLFQNKFRNIENEKKQKTVLVYKNYLNIVNDLEQFKLHSSNHLKNKFLDSIENSNNTNEFFLKKFILFKTLNIFINNLVYIFLIILLSKNIWENNFSIGKMFLFLSIFNFFHQPFNSLIFMLIEYPIINQYVDNINSFLSFENEIYDDTKNKIKKIKKIELKNIDFNYPSKKTMLKINNLLINSSIRLIGDNGSGKTTFLKLISTVILDNKIYFNDKPINYYDLNSIRNQICFITNNETLPNGTVFEYLTSNDKIKKDNLLINIEKYKLLDLFEKLNLNLHTNIEDNCKNLSFGQKQFISIMRLFTFDYSLILLDEVFENFEDNFLKQLFLILKNHLKNKIVIEVSHRKNYLFKSNSIDCNLFK